MKKQVINQIIMSSSRGWMGDGSRLGGEHFSGQWLQTVLELLWFMGRRHLLCGWWRQVKGTGQEFITHVCPQETAIANTIRFALHLNLLLTAWHWQEWVVNLDSSPFILHYFVIQSLSPFQAQISHRGKHNYSRRGTQWGIFLEITIKNCDGSEILLYLQSKKLAHYSFMNAGKGHDSWVKDKGQSIT